MTGRPSTIKYRRTDNCEPGDNNHLC